MKKLFIGRASLIGDLVAATVLLPYFKKLYPDSYIYWPVAKKVSQCAPLMIGNKYVDKIHILEEYESLGKNDIDLINSCDIYVNPFPQHDGVPGINNFWWNERNMVQETVKMAGVDLNHFNSILTEEERKPRLEKWFNVEKTFNSIALWPFAGYAKEPLRSPSFAWYKELIVQLNTLGYSVIHFGHYLEPHFFEGNDRYRNLTYLPFTEQIKLTLGCYLAINSDSGSGICLGAYGFSQISLLIKNAPNHITNLDAFGILNYNNVNINLLGLNGQNSINHEQVLEAIKQLL